jgi:hypothetical protein
MADQSSASAFAKDTYSLDAGYANLRGQFRYAKDSDTVAGVYTENSQIERQLVLVKNTSGGALPTGAALQFDTAWGQNVKKAVSGGHIRGYVPPVINGSASGTIPDQAYFWMVKVGPTKVLKSTTNVAVDDLIEVSSTSGQVKSSAGTGYPGVLGGSFIAADSSGNSVLVRAYANCQW